MSCGETSGLARADRLAALGALAAGIAHEINNPMAFVIANLDESIATLAALNALLEPSTVCVVEEVLGLLRDARDGAERVRLIARDVKTFSRGVDGPGVPVDLRRVLDATVRIAITELRKRAAIVRDYGPLPMVEGTEASLGQVFLNLLINAAHAIPAGGPEQHSIRLTTWTDEGGQAVVEVRDTGVGIPPASLARIFEPFYTTKPEGVGTGLGLSITHDLVKSLGGSIEVESEVGRGTAFRVVLPPAGARSPLSDRVPRRGRVLVVDDDPVVGEALQRILEPEHDALTVTSASDALRALAGGGSFDAILADLEMPGMNGLELFAAVSAGRPSLIESFGFVSGGASSPEVLALLAEAPTPVFDKPFDRDALMSFVRARTRRRG